MENATLTQLRRRYQLETSALRLQSRDQKLTEDLKQAKYARRTCQEKQMAYEGSFRSFLHRLSGKKEDRAEVLSRELRQVEAALNALLRDQEKCRQELADVRQELENLPPLEVLQEIASQTAETAAEAFRLEALFCAGALIPTLEENYSDLFELRRVLRGDRAGEIQTYEERQAIWSAPDISGEKCRSLLQRLESAAAGLDIPFEIGNYYRSPTAFIVSVAASHNRLDRVNQAMDQAAAAKKQAARLLEQLEE